MNLPEGFSVFGKRNARELAVLRAENALMRMAGALPVIDPLILVLPPAKMRDIRRGFSGERNFRQP